MPKLTRLVGDAPCGMGSCPAIFISDDQRLYVQGHRVHDDIRAALDLQNDEEAVEIPLGFLADVARVKRSRSDEHSI